MDQTKDVITQYYNALRTGIAAGFIHLDQLPFDEKIHLFTSQHKMVGKVDVFALYLELLKVIQSFELRQIFVAKESACAIVEFNLYNVQIPILTADWFHLKNGKIAKIHVIYDTAASEKVMQI